MSSVVPPVENPFQILELPLEMVLEALSQCKEPTTLNQVCRTFYQVTSSAQYKNIALVIPTLAVLREVVNFHNREIQLLVPENLSIHDKVLRLTALLRGTRGGVVEGGNLERFAKLQYNTRATVFQQFNGEQLDESFLDALYLMDAFTAKILASPQFTTHESEVRFTATIKALAFAIMINDLETIQRILQQDDTECPLQEKLTRGFSFAAGCGKPELMRLFLNLALQHSIPLGAPDVALYLAAKYGRMNTVEIILSNSTALQATSSDLLGQVVIIAASVGDESALRWLLATPLNVELQPNGPNGLGRALSLAAQGGFTGIIQLIFDHPGSREINPHGPYSIGLAHAEASTHLHYEAMELISSHFQ